MTNLGDLPSNAPIPPEGLGKGIVSAGKCINAAEHSRTSTSFGTLPTPDVVSIVLPTDGLIVVAFQGLWQSAVSWNNARAAIFIGTNQLKVRQGDDIVTPVTQGASFENSLSGNYAGLNSCPLGLISGSNSSDANSDLTTGQVVGQDFRTVAGGVMTFNDVPRNDTVYGTGNGGPCHIFAAAGTYDVSIQFKHTTGSQIDAKERKLWVWALGF